MQDVAQAQVVVEEDEHNNNRRRCLLLVVGLLIVVGVAVGAAVAASGGGSGDKDASNKEIEEPDTSSPISKAPISIATTMTPSGSPNKEECLGVDISGSGECYSLCPSGADPAYPNRKLPRLIFNEEPLTCEYFDLLIKDNPGTPEWCQDIHLLTLAGFCGCPCVPKVNHCSFCPDGSKPANGGLTTPLFGDLCNDLNDFFSYFSAEECASDYSSQFLSDSIYCGCPNVEPACTMCDKGSPTDLQVPYQLLNDEPVTCLTWSAYADELIANGAGTCNGDIRFYGGYCGCENIERPYACTFCPDGSPVPNKFVETPYRKDRCGDLERYVSFFTESQCNSAALTDIQEQYAFHCNCPNTSITCSLCPEGSELIPDQVVTLASGPLTCQEISHEVSILSAEDCAKNQPQPTAELCCSGYSSFSCPVCPDGSSVPDPDKATQFINNIDTCGQVEELFATVIREDCASNQESLDVEAYFCGCPGAESPCSLCSNGLSPPDPSRAADMEATSCGEVDALIRTLTATSCQEQKVAVLSNRAACCDE